MCKQWTQKFPCAVGRHLLVSNSRVGISGPTQIEARDMCCAKNLSAARQSSYASQVSIHPAALGIGRNAFGSRRYERQTIAPNLARFFDARESVELLANCGENFQRWLLQFVSNKSGSKPVQPAMSFNDLDGRQKNP